MFKSGALTALAAIGVVTLGGMTVTSTPAEAGWRKGYYGGPAYGHRAYGGHGGYYRQNRHGGRNAALGIAAGVLAIGALAAASGSAYAAPSYSYQQSYGYAQPVYYAPRCHIRHRTVWDPHYGYVSQPVRVCR